MALENGEHLNFTVKNTKKSPHMEPVMNSFAAITKPNIMEHGLVVLVLVSLVSQLYKTILFHCNGTSKCGKHVFYFYMPKVRSKDNHLKRFNKHRKKENSPVVK